MEDKNVAALVLAEFAESKPADDDTLEGWVRWKVSDVCKYGSTRGPQIRFGYPDPSEEHIDRLTEFVLSEVHRNKRDLKKKL